jgi:hypothetical protein
MIDVYATSGTFADKHTLAQDLAKTVMKWEEVPEISLFKDNTAAFVHDLPADAADGDLVKQGMARVVTNFALAGH